MSNINDWKGKDKHNNEKAYEEKTYFFIEQLCQGAMRICVAHNIEEAINKLDEIGLKYGHKTDITKITVKSTDEIINVGVIY